MPKALRIITQVGGALDYAHNMGVIHRDFKPGNVLLDKFNNFMLTDFGIAKLMEGTTHLTATGGILGTPIYVSPEQGRGETVDGRSDIYSLGVVLYQMVTARCALSGGHGHGGHLHAHQRSAALCPVSVCRIWPVLSSRSY